MHFFYTVDDSSASSPIRVFVIVYYPVPLTGLLSQLPHRSHFTMVKAVVVLKGADGASGTVFFSQEGDGKIPSILALRVSPLPVSLTCMILF